MKRRVFWMPIAVVVTCALTSSADAPPDQYAQFDATDQTITDNKTTLIWQRHVDTTVRDLPGARAYCASLTLGTEVAPFRVPTIKELQTILDEQPHDEYLAGASSTKYIDRNAFPGTPDGDFITEGPANVWTLDFHSGAMNPRSAIATGFVRCVK